MTTTSWIFIAVSALAAGLDWWSVHTGNERIEQGAKPAVLVALILAVWADELSGGEQLWLLVALIAGLFGDVLLLPRVDKFVAGLASFLVGHLAYTGLAASIGMRSLWMLVGLLIASSMIATVGTKITDSLHGTSYFVPVVAYILTIGLTTTLLVGTGRLLLVSGALLFVVSDALLGYDRFINAAPGGRVAVHATYHLAQIFLVLGALN
ncbi:MAG: lysoplasmalogenase [Acidimicrobiales bacterium]|nr:lysoplasmalogenase [Acidimicrobiales bacterium]